MEIVVTPLRRLYHWVGDSAHGQYGEGIIAGMFFIEAIIYMPADPLLVVYCVKRPDKALRYGAIAAVASVLGGLMSYAIGLFLWHYVGNQIIYNTIINYAIAPETFHALFALYQKYQCFALLIAGFLPIPYKAAVLTAGFCQLALVPFLICSCITRSIRFLTIAYLVQTFGPQIQDSIDRYFNIFVFLKIAIIGYVLWLFVR